MTAWKDLPNATHIDQVLADLKSHPREFSAAWNAARAAAWDAAWGAAWGAAWDEARDAVRDAAWDAAWDAARDAAGLAARDAAGDAIMALIAWDHSSKYLDMTHDELGVWYQLNEDPACALLLTYVRARELIAQKIGT
jgi:hypothetical protein